MPFVSYAQNGEDILLFRALASVGNGFYIDVGASDPNQDSVTRAFYERGWRGINIEPLPEYHKMLVRERPHDVNLCLAIGRTPAASTTLHDFGIRGLATQKDEILQKHLQRGFTATARTVPLVTLTEVCEKHAPESIHFLKIDVEGCEADVLAGMDFDRFRPWIVVCEATIPNSQDANHAEWEPLLQAGRYRFAYFDGLNRYYVASEHEDRLLNTLGVQPNVFDEHITAAQHQAELTVVELQERINVLEKELDLSRAADRSTLSQEQPVAVDPPLPLPSLRISAQSKPRILMLTTYPIARPRHGGQLRAQALVETYLEAGFDVSTLAVYEQQTYSGEDLGPLDVPFDIHDPKWQRGVPFVTDVMSGLFAASDDGAFRTIERKIPERIDIFHIEQPWLLPLVERLMKLPEYANSKVVFGSQNLEEPLKRAIFKMYGIQDQEVVLSEIAQLESRACSKADVVLAVTESEAKALRLAGAPAVVVARNGIARWNATHENLKRWSERLPQAPWALFVASSHPPSISGFFDCLGDSLACIPPTSRLVVAGGIGSAIRQGLLESRASLNDSRLLVIGELPDEDLAAVKSLASIFILPITRGSGSNIKTAEALFSRTHVVGTTIAFRGFEDYLSLPEIVVADTRADFRAALSRLLQTKRASPVLSEVDPVRERLLWGQTLLPAAAAAITCLNSREVPRG